MRPELFTIPILGLPIKSYGFMMMLGFLVSIWFAMRRAERVKADPDIILNIGFISLICGVVGARVFFVAHYWKSEFAWQSNPVLAAFNITAGGLEYYGGLVGALLGALIYLRFFARFRAVGDDLKSKPRRRASMRLYLDILAPSVMLGLAFGRMGCFLNGCCWGGVCAHQDQGEVQADLPWAMTFPFGSGAQNRQWENRQLGVPAELIFDDPRHVTGPYLLFADSLREPDAEFDELAGRMRELKAQLQDAKQADPGGERAKELSRQIKATKQQAAKLADKHFTVLANMQYPSREDPSQPMSKAELTRLAAQYRSLPVHPAQLYALVNALLLSVLLGRVFYRRSRHGVVIGLMLVLYPITRIILELIRVDNPHDTAGLTISQAVSVAMMVVGVVWVAMLYLKLPRRSERALPYAPLPLETQGKTAHA